MKKKKKNYFYKWKVHTLQSGITCEICGNPSLYFCKYDAEFCPKCNQWVFSTCTDPDCSFCSDRPDTPEEALAICNLLFSNEITLEKHISKKEHTSKRYDLNEKYKKRKKYILDLKNKKEFLGKPKQKGACTKWEFM